MGGKGIIFHLKERWFLKQFKPFKHLKDLMLNTGLVAWAKPAKSFKQEEPQQVDPQTNAE